MNRFDPWLGQEIAGRTPRQEGAEQGNALGDKTKAALASWANAASA